MLEWVCWIGLLLIAYPYAIYPLLLIGFNRLSGRRLPAPNLQHQPTVSIVMPVHNERGKVPAKIRNLLELDYPQVEVVVVDDDVDLFDPKDVEWAVATRFRADEDLVVITGAKGNELGPSTQGTAITSKMGMDATKPFGEAGRFEKVRIPGMKDIDVADSIS